MDKILLQSHTIKNIHYLSCQGEGDHTILIIHGRGGSSESWRDVGEGLAKNGYSVIIPDLPGFGKTILPNPFTVDDYAHWIKEFLHIVLPKIPQGNKLTIVGHSNGGRIITYAVSNHIISCDYLVFNGAAGIPLPQSNKIKSSLLSRGKYLYKCLPGLSVARTVIYKLLGGHDYLQAEKDPQLKQTFLNMLQTVYPDDTYRQIKIPVLLIRGDKDTYTPLWMGKKIAELLGDSTLIICKNQKHGIHLSDPQRIIDEIGKFYKKVR